MWLQESWGLLQSCAMLRALWTCRVCHWDDQHPRVLLGTNSVSLPFDLREETGEGNGSASLLEKSVCGKDTNQDLIPSLSQLLSTCDLLPR